MKVLLKTKETKRNKYKKTVSLLLFFGFILFFIGINISTKDVINFIKLKGFQGPAFQSNTSSYIKAIPNEFLSSLFQNHDVDEMRIDIDFIEWKKLSESKNIAIKNGIISDNEKQYVDASISYKGDKRKVKLRIKGDFVDHLLGDKWSLRIKVFISGL